MPKESGLVLVVILIAVLVALGGLGGFGYYFVTQQDGVSKVMDLVAGNPIYQELALKEIKTSEESVDIIPEDWEEFIVKNTETGIQTTLRLPPPFVFVNVDNNNRFWIKNKNSSEAWEYTNSVFKGKDGVKNYYDGASRRIWYNRLIDGEFSLTGPATGLRGNIIEVKGHPAGPKSYLELSILGHDSEKHYLYSESKVVHIIKPAVDMRIIDQLIPKNLGLIFYSLTSGSIE